MLHISMTRIAELLNARDIPTEMYNSGGGNMILNVGVQDPITGFPVTLGPGYVGAEGVFAWSGDFYYGPDETYVADMTRDVPEDATVEDVAKLVADMITGEEVNVSLTLNAGTITAYWSGREDGPFTQRVFSDYTLDEIRRDLSAEIGGRVTFNEPTRNH